MTDVLDRVSVGEEVAARLREAILAGQWAPGDALPETLLAERYRVSRPSVRDALRRLAHEGLVTHAAHRGATVTRIEPAEIRDIMLVRLTIEPSVVRRFGLGNGIGEALRAAVERLERAARQRDWAAYGAADIDFHETLVSAARSPRLTSVHGRSMQPLRLHLASADRAAERPGADPRHVGEHRQILALLEAGDRDAAARVLVRHLEDALAMLEG